MDDKSDSSDKDFNPEDCESEESSDSENNETILQKDDKIDETNYYSNKTQNNDSDKKFVGQAIADGHKFNTQLVCIKYPGNVVNPEKAVETLGGIVTISETLKSHNRRMELRFRPDGYCKPACGDRQKTAGFLLRIRVKKSRREKLENASNSNGTATVVNYSSHENDTESVIHINDKRNSGNFNDLNKNQTPTFDGKKYENLSEDADYQLPKLKVLGRVESEFRFTNLCDFQYLPITKNLEDPTKDECIYDSIYPVGLPKFSWLKEEVPYFLPPAAFSRMDTVQPYTPKTEHQDANETAAIGKTRKRRAGFSNYITFNTPVVPVNPPKGIETAMKVKFLQSSHLEKMRECFEERPIWSKTALMYVTKFSSEQMKILLPSVAYYFMTGPWRITWVKLGYDPRMDPNARIYQVLDYRLKAMHGLHSSITCKRNYSEYTLPYKNSAVSKAKAMVLTPHAGEKIQKPEKLMSENVYIYRPGTIPPSRQMFYQYCDVYVDEIQENLAKYVNPPPGTRCDEKTGWLSKDFDGYCREIINKQIRQELRKLLRIPENLPTSLPRKRRLVPSGKIRKRYPKKAKSDKPQTQSADDIPSENDEEWEDIEDIEEDDINFSTNESEPEDDVDNENV